MNFILPLDRRLVCLGGALLCFVFDGVTSIDASGTIAIHDPLRLIDVKVLLVLFSIMLLNHIVMHQPVVVNMIEKVQQSIITSSSSSSSFYLVGLISFIASMFITNDGLCLFLVFPVLDSFVLKYSKQNHCDTISDINPLHTNYSSDEESGTDSDNTTNAAAVIEYASRSDTSSASTDKNEAMMVHDADPLYYMLNIACSANLGSSCTFQGNPQNIIIAGYVQEHRLMSGGYFFILLIVPAFICWMVNSLYLNYLRCSATDIANRLRTVVDADVKDVKEKVKSGEEHAIISYIVYASFLLLIICEFLGVSSMSSLFTSISITLVIVTIVLKYYIESGPFRSNSYQYRQKISSYIEDIFITSIDYNLLLIFTGLFLVAGYFVETSIPSSIFTYLSGNVVPFTTAKSLYMLSIYIVIGSQLVGNVPLVVMVAKELSDVKNKHDEMYGWVLLAWISTIAGNLTLTGSAANIIVAEKAIRHKLSIEVTAYDHWKACGCITIMLTVLGICVISLEFKLIQLYS